MNPRVDFFFSKAGQWKKEYGKLRAIVLDCGLTEELKWGSPCYTFEKKNIVLIHGFKEYCALLFFKGALMKDPGGILIQQTRNVQAGRQIRFTSLQQIVKMEKTVKIYIYRAVAVEEAGLKIDLKKTSEFSMPAELEKKLKAKPAFRKAFEALTPGRQRGYLLYFSAAKQSKTREDRIEKWTKPILAGRGLRDE